MRTALFPLLYAVIALACPAQTAGERPKGEGEAAGLRLLPQALRAAMERVGPSLVRIDSYGAGPIPVPVKKGPKKTVLENEVGVSEGPATGLILDQEGHILSSTFSLARRHPVLIVTLASGKSYDARVLGQDRVRRICLLKIECRENLVVPPFFSPAQIRLGQWALALGQGHDGESPALSLGIISALGRFSGRVIQTDANLSPVNYGGPLVDIEGRVLGICVPMSSTAEGPVSGVELYDSGIGFAIPVAPDSELIARLKKGEDLLPGHLGLLPSNLPDGTGVFVSQVSKSSAAESAGIRAGDIIQKVNGHPVFMAEALKSLIRNFHAQDRVEVQLIRSKKNLTVQVTLTSSAQAE